MRGCAGETTKKKKTTPKKQRLREIKTFHADKERCRMVRWTMWQCASLGVINIGQRVRMCERMG